MGQGLLQMCGFLGKVPHELGNRIAMAEYDMDEEFEYLKAAWNEKTHRENEAIKKAGR